MTTNQEGLHATVRALTSTERSYNEDWHALFDDEGIAAGPFDSRMLAWINATLSTSYTNVNEAMQAFAVEQGFANWASMNTFESGFSLSSLPNVAALYEPYDTSKVFVERTSPATPSSVSGVVGSLLDTSASARHLSTSADSKRPILREGVAGNYLEFDNVDDNLRVAFTLAQPLTRIVLLKQRAWTNGDYLIDGGTTGNLYLSQTSASPTFFTRLTFAGLTRNYSTAAIGDWFVFTEVVNGASSKTKINNDAFNAISWPTTDLTGTSIGANGAGTTAPSAVDFGGMVICSAVLSDTDIAAAVTFLGAKQGLAI